MWPFPFVFSAFFSLSLALTIMLLQPSWTAAAETADIDVGLYALGAFPSDRGLFAQGVNPSGIRIANGAGAGITIWEISSGSG